MPTNSFSFGINFQTDLCSGSKSDIRALLSGSLCPIIMDSIAYELHKDIFTPDCKQQILLLPAGEEHKSQETVTRIYHFLLECNVSRNTEVFAIGGGTITDVVAYAVSTFKRGCRLILIPSTLLGMIDASVGGKTAINHNAVKNLIGTFYPAQKVMIVPELLHSLSDAELQNGLAEMLKLRFILPDLPDPDFRQHTYPTIELILEYAKAKLNICTHDLDDLGNRRLLNLGHTFGHILESSADYSIPHGEAVIWGIAVAAGISKKLGLITNAVSKRIIAGLKQHGFQTELDSVQRDSFIAAFPELIMQDKKKASDMLTLVLFKDSAQVAVFDNIPLQSVIELLPKCI